MQFPQSFVPTAAQVGAVAMLTEWLLLAATYAFLGAAVFFLVTRLSVAPRRRAAMAILTVVGLVSALTYWTISAYFHDMLHQLSATADAASKRRLIHDAYLAIAPYRSAGWAVTMPLLALVIPSTLNARLREMARPVGGLMAAAFVAVLAGYLGEQGINPDGAVSLRARLLFGLVALAAYGVVPYLLFRIIAPRFGGGADNDEARAFRAMCWMTLTAWSVYPLGYLVPLLAPGANFNWLHLVMTLADLVNQLGVGAICYVAAAAELERRVPYETIQAARTVG